MKYLVLTLSLLASASASMRFNDEIRDFFEYLRTQMPCGSEEHGIPPLAPYKEVYRTIDFENLGLAFVVNVTDTRLEGLDSFEFHQLSYETLISVLKFNVTFKQLRLFGQYEARGAMHVFGLPFAPYGDGDMELILKDVNLKGYLRFSQGILKGITLKAFKVSTEIGSVESKTNGVMHSSFFSNFFNEWVKEMFALILDENQNEVSNFMGDLIKPRIDCIFSKMKLVHMLGLALGLNELEIKYDDLPVCNVN